MSIYYVRVVSDGYVRNFETSLNAEIDKAQADNLDVEVQYTASGADGRRHNALVIARKPA